MKCRQCKIELLNICPDCKTEIKGDNIICGQILIPKHHCFNCWVNK